MSALDDMGLTSCVHQGPSEFATHSGPPLGNGLDTLRPREHPRKNDEQLRRLHRVYVKVGRKSKLPFACPPPTAWPLFLALSKRVRPTKVPG